MCVHFLQLSKLILTLAVGLVYIYFIDTSWSLGSIQEYMA